MAQTIILKHGTGSSAPNTLAQGELAINVSSGSFWYGSGSAAATQSNFCFGEITASNQIRNYYGNHTGTGAITASGTVTAVHFVGEGSGITGVTAEWDGTHTGTATFTGKVTASAGMSVAGDLAVTGTVSAAIKSFLIPHPTIENKKLVYGALEGPEHAVYYRGIVTENIIELPEEWTALVHEDSITVQLTPIGKSQNLYVSDISSNKIFIKTAALFNNKINAFYLVQATRKDVKKLETIQ